VVVQPTTLTVSGEVAAVSALTSVGTEPIDLAGSSETIQGLTPVRLPEDVTTVGGVQEVLVTLVIEADEGSRTLEAGIRLDGARRTRTYTLSTPSVLVTLAGPLPTLDALDPATIVAVVDVAGLGSGTHEVEVTVEAIEGLQVSSVAPASIRVQVAPAPTAPPSTEPTAAPSDEPTAQPASEPAPTAPIDSQRSLPGSSPVAP
jgi:YbbR domain-containing protein